MLLVKHESNCAHAGKGVRMTSLLTIIICFAASTVGSICGIGGGVIIKPVLDAVGTYSVDTVAFLSSCTVLAMSGYSVLKSCWEREGTVNWHTTTFLGVGSAAGGILGKYLFSEAILLLDNENSVGSVQSAILLFITCGTILYTLKKARIPTRNLQNRMGCVLVGLALGVLSSFLGIGGGPINLVVLFYFFSMPTKIAAQNSLYVILLSQISSLLFTLCTGEVPPIPGLLLVSMMLAGIGGSVLGRRLNRNLSHSLVDRLFLGLMVVIQLICVYNLIHFSAAS